MGLRPLTWWATAIWWGSTVGILLVMLVFGWQGLGLRPPKASCLMRLLSNGQMAVTAPVRDLHHGDFQVAGMQMMGVPM